MKQQGRDLIHLPGISTSLETGTAGHALSAVSPRLLQRPRTRSQKQHAAQQPTELDGHQPQTSLPFENRR